jgi:hypothetical protein
MTAPLAFQVAVNTALPEVIGTYDPDQQQFVWEGDNEVTLGYPLCSYTCASNRCGCSTTSTACNYSYTCGLGQCGYRCDYG